MSQHLKGYQRSITLIKTGRLNKKNNTNINTQKKRKETGGETNISMSVVCKIRAPYLGGWNFRQYFFAALYLSHFDLRSTVQNFTEIVPGEPLRRGR